jgi:hypothetical protein
MTRVIVDTAPPVIIPQITGTGPQWMVPEQCDWSIANPESGIASSSGCVTANLTVETAGVTLKRSATDGAGLSSSVPVTIKESRSQDAEMLILLATKDRQDSARHFRYAGPGLQALASKMAS